MKTVSEMIERWKASSRETEIARIHEEAQSRFNIERVIKESGAAYDVVTFDGYAMSAESESFDVCNKLAYLRQDFIKRRVARL